MEFVLLFLAGLAAGSFLNVCIHRLPRRESVVRPASRCLDCGARLNAVDLVPVLSWLVLRGRCRYCGLPINPRYPLVELLTGSAFAGAYLAIGPDPFALAKALFFVALLIVAAFTDLEHMLIPNRLILAGLAGGAVFAVVLPEPGVVSALAGTAACGGLLLLLAVVSRGGMGGGDVKLAAVVGLFLGLPLGLLVLFVASLLGSAAGIGMRLGGVLKRGEPLPFGPFIAAGAVVALFWGDAVLDWYLAGFFR
ncbi:MAG: prepilin peptidase [Candidatus Desulforudis sp.]|nr:prepilin peptidase [Desulforudis sp.]